MKKLSHILQFIFSTSKLPIKLKKIINVGIKVSFILLLFSTLLMVLYIDFKPSNELFEISSILIKSFSTFISCFIIFGAAFNRLLQDLKK